MVPVPTAEDLEIARAVLTGVVRKTPLLTAPALDRAVGARVFVKAESLQLTGSFKVRGAYLRLTRLASDERARGVVAYSSGNFAQGLAAAGRLLGIPVTIVMPEDAPIAKIDATRDYGAKVVLSHHGDAPREVVASARAQAIAAETGATLLHPFDDPWIVAGQSTAAQEMLEQAAALGVALDAVLVPVGGGGLLAGCALACDPGATQAGAAVYAVEPAGYDDFARSLAGGERLRNTTSPRTLCDALQATMPGQVTFAVARARVARGLVVDDAAIRKAMGLAFQHLKIVLEPSGAIGLAALLDLQIVPHLGLSGRNVGVLASGGNIALGAFAALANA